MPQQLEVRRLEKLVRDSLHTFVSDKGYNQAIVRRKLDALGYKVSAATISNCLKEKRVGVNSLEKLIKGLNELLGEELGYRIDIESGSINRDVPKSFQPKIIEEHIKAVQNDSGVKIHDGGRLPLKDKLAFWDAAESEIIELGVRLNTLTNCFFHRSDNEFKNRIIAILDRGVNIKLALLDPHHYKTEVYFKDRSEYSPEDINSQEVIEKSISSLSGIITEINEIASVGKIQLFKYRHIPYNNFVIIDGRKTNGKMLVAHYLYGQRRASSPIIEVHRRRNFELYKLYLDSYKAIIKGAARVV